MLVDVVATEHYLRGKVYVDNPAALLMIDDGSEWYSSGLRELAAEALERAEQLDRLEGGCVLDDRGQLAGHEPQNR